MATTTITVRLISAPWCKRCHEMKPDIAAHVAIADATLETVNFDELEDGDPVRASVVSLPTIHMQTVAGGPWVSYTAATFDAWKSAILAAALVRSADVDF